MKRENLFWLPLLVLAAVISLSSAAQAGFTNINLTLIINGGNIPLPPGATIALDDWGHFEWSFDIPPEANGDAFLEFGERLTGMLPDWITLEMSGETDADPVMHITKTVTNETDYTWTAYDIALAGTGVSFVPGTATSDKFGSVTESPLLLNYESPIVVAPDETVVCDFDILVETLGSFSFTLSQTPIPEPTALALIGLGCLGLARRRR